MAGLFFIDAAFNADIGYWDVSNVTNMDSMFNFASNFNQPIGNWNVGNVTGMGSMFNFATDFNQDLSGWDVEHISSEPGNFGGSPAWTSDKKPRWGGAQNEAPIADAGDPQTVAEGERVTLDGTGSSDPEDQTLTYVWTQTDGESVMLSDLTAAQPTFTAPTGLAADTELSFTLVVNDGTQDSDPATVSITVTANEAPTADAGSAQTVAEGERVTLDGTGSSDPEGQTLTYDWTQTGGESVTLSDATAAQPTFTAPTGLAADTELSFTLVVNDGTQDSDPATVSITVTANEEAPEPLMISSVTFNGELVTNNGEPVTNGQEIRVMETTGEYRVEYSHTGTGSFRVDDIGVEVDYDPDWDLTKWGGGFNQKYPSVGHPDQVTFVDVDSNVVFTFTVVNEPAVNNPPTADAGDPQTVAEGERVTLDGTGSSDPENQTLTYTWTQTEGESVTLSDATAVQPTFTAPTGLAADTELSFTLVVNDGEHDSVPAMVQITVTAAEEAPEPLVISSVTFNGEQVTNGQEIRAMETTDGYRVEYSHTGTGSFRVDDIGVEVVYDPDWDLTNWVDTFGDNVFNQSYPPAGRSDQVTFVDVDSNVVFTFTVVNEPAVNNPPTADAGDPQTVAEGERVTLDGTGSSDPEDQTLTYTWTQTEGESVTLSDATAAQPTFTAPTGLAADTELSFTLVVNDGTQDSDPATVSITVTANEAPTAEAGSAQTVAEGELVTLDGTGSSDPENQTLTYAWTQTGGDPVTLSDATAVQPTFTAPTGLAADTELSFTLVVNDGTQDSDPATVSITVTANEAPTAEAGSAQTVAEGERVTLDGTGSSDPEDQTLTYAWTQTGGESVTLSDATAVQPTFTAPTGLAADTELSFTLVVNDGTQDSDPATVSITVTANEVPTADAGDPQTVAEGERVTLDGTGSSDPENQTLTYAWTQTGGDPVTLSDATAVQPTFTAPTGLAADTELSFTLVVNDGTQDSDPATVSITVTANEAPTAEAGSAQTVAEGERVTLDGTGSSDPEDQTLTYAWTQTGGESVMLSDTTAVQPTFTAPTGLAADTELSFTLVVNDGTQDSDPATVSITVTANEAPTAEAGSAQTVAEGELVTLDGTGSSDPENQALTYAWTQTGGDPVTLSDATAVQPTFTAPTGLAADTELSFTLVVNDGTQDSDPATVIITVTSTEAMIVEQVKQVNTVLLPEVVMAATESALSNIADRVDAVASGARPQASNLASQEGIAQLLKTHGKGIESGTTDLLDIFGGQSFTLSATDDEAGDIVIGASSLTLWGGVDYQSLSGDDAAIDWDGDQSSYALGADIRLRRDLLAGVAVSRATGEFDYTDKRYDLDGTYESELTALNPYVSLIDADDRLRLWGTVGYGWGEITIDPSNAEAMSSDVTSWFGGVGSSLRLVRRELAGGAAASLRLKMEGSVVHSDVEGAGLIDSLTVDAQRLRAGLSGEYEREFGDDGATVRTSLDMVLRHDGGDGVTGTGLEAGGGLSLTWPLRGLTVGLNGRRLLRHGSDYDEWGLSGMVRLESGSNDGGLSLSLQPSYGNMSDSAQSFYEAERWQGLAANDNETLGVSLSSEVGYGIVGRDDGVLTPYVGYDRGDDNRRRYDMGIRFESGAYSYQLSGERVELQGRIDQDSESDYSIMLRLNAEW